MTAMLLLRRALGARGRAFLKERLRRWGYEPRRRAPVDFTGLGLDDPFEAWRRCGGAPLLVDVPLARCRNLDLMGFACEPGDGNPFVATARAVLEGRATRYEGSPLQAYYRAFQPKAVGDIWGWPAKDCAPDLLAPALHAVAPWQATPGPHMLAARRRVNRIDHAELGVPHDPEDASWLEFGPVSAAKGSIEFRRLERCVRSIRDRGYEAPAEVGGHMTAHFLVRGGRSVAWMINGHHRIAALAALGLRRATILFERAVYRREEVETWPGVRSGAFTPAQALQAFDCVFEGRRMVLPGSGSAESGGSEQRVRRVRPA